MDIKQKKAKLADLKREVDDFHPILEELFINLEGITNVEHTHGANEMGADFILYKTNQLFGTIDRIGVIVKLGVIKQDNADVERQIEECGVPRIFKFDNIRGYFKEIWVVSNETITAGAKEKINEKHKNTKVSFVDSDILCRWIDEYLQSYWDELSAGISSYIKRESIACESDDLKLSLIDSAPHAYIEQDIIKNNRDKIIARRRECLPREETVDIFKEVDMNSVVIIEGEMGSGKSKLLRKMFEHYCDTDIFKKYKLLPVRISFTKYMEDYEGNSEKLLDSLLKLNNNIQLNTINGFVLLVDAVDEYRFGQDKQIELFEDVLSKVEDIYKSKPIKHVFTTREISAVENHPTINNTRRYFIKSISNAKLFKFLCEICTELTQNDRLLEDLKNSELFKDLPNYPMSAILLAKLINEGEYKDLPMTITELYKKYAELSLGRWDMQRGLESEQEYKIANRFALNLANYMFENGTTRIDFDCAKLILDDYIEKRNFDDVNSEQLYIKLIERSGMFIKIETDNVLIFKHRTFADYFYAQYLHSEKKSMFNLNIFSPIDHNIAMFYIGIENDCLDVLEKVIATKPKNDFERFYRPFVLADYLLAGYATEYDVVKKNLCEIFVEMAKLYLDIINQKIVVPFSALPEAHILWLFQAILRDKYSYHYFRNALDHSCMSIEELECDEEIKVLALFFSGCIKVELKFNNPFEYLITFHEKSIPDSAKYIVLQEAENISEHSVRLKNLTRRIKKDIRKSNIKYRQLLTKPIIPPTQLKEKLASAE